MSSCLPPAPRPPFRMQVSGAVIGMDFTADGRFLMLNSSGMDMVIVNAETCKKASPKDMKALRYPQPPGWPPETKPG